MPQPEPGLMDRTIVDMFRDLATDRAEHPALVCGERSITYAALDERANRLANALLAEGVGVGSRVAYLDVNEPEFFETMLACLKIGAAVAPVNFRLTPREMGVVVDDAQAPVLVLGHRFATLADPLREGAPGLRRIIVTGDDYEQWIAGCDTADPGYAGGPDDVVLQLYTSGTTGLPKGVLITNANCSALLMVADEWSVDESSVCMVAMPLFHIGGSGWAMVGLARGATDVLVPELDPAGLLDLIEQRQITNAFIVPAVLHMMTSVPGADDRSYPSLRSIAYGASPITPPVLRRSLEVLKAPLYQVYGLTETTGAITQLSADDHDPGGPREHLMRSAGRAYPWVELKAVDPATGQDSGLGEVGEIHIRSVQVTPGYWNKPDETKSAIDEEGWLHTGDAGYVDDEGYVFLTDRIKDMIVSGAENVYPIEVETVLAEHPDVADVAVIGVPDEKWGETVKAIVVRCEGSGISEQALLEYGKQHLAGFKRPRSVDFVEDLPRNPSGKLLKRVLREPYWESQGGRRIG
jgi:acyl-CoA synthetase (AMP-forming)/AMP-acid ligase II